MERFQFKTNVVGVTHTINAFLPLLRAGKTKKVLVVSSSMGSPKFCLDVNYAPAPAYSISKAALNMVVAKFSTKFKNEGFTFIAISPGLLKTLPGRKWCLFAQSQSRGSNTNGLALDYKPKRLSTTSTRRS